MVQRVWLFLPSGTSADHHFKRSLAVRAGEFLVSMQRRSLLVRLPAVWVSDSRPLGVRCYRFRSFLAAETALGCGSAGLVRRHYHTRGARRVCCPARWTLTSAGRRPTLVVLGCRSGRPELVATSAGVGRGSPLIAWEGQANSTALHIGGLVVPC